MDLRRLRPAEILAALAGAVLVLSLWLDWYAVPIRVGATPEIVTDAWNAFGVVDVILLVTGLAGLGLAIVQAAQRSPALPAAASVVVTSLGLLATLLVAYRLVDQPGPDEFVSVRAGAWIGLAAALGVAIGGWRSMASEVTPHAPPAPEAELRPAPPAS